MILNKAKINTFFLNQKCRDEDIVNFLKEYQLYLYLKGFLHLRKERINFTKKPTYFQLNVTWLESVYLTYSTFKLCYVYHSRSRKPKKKRRENMGTVYPQPVL